MIAMRANERMISSGWHAGASREWLNHRQPPHPGGAANGRLPFILAVIRDLPSVD
jgi:hypothetical protein